MGYVSSTFKEFSWSSENMRTAHYVAQRTMSHVDIRAQCNLYGFDSLARLAE